MFEYKHFDGYKKTGKKLEDILEKLNVNGYQTTKIDEENILDTHNAFKNKHTDFLATKKFCELLGCTEIHLEKFLKRNNEFKIKNILKVDNKKYNKFIKNFLKFENSYKITIWDKVLSELKFNKNI